MTNDVILRFTFRLPKKLLDDLKITAKEQGYSLNALILHILWEWDYKLKGV